VALRRWVAAVLASAALVLAAPWIGTLRAWVQSAFPGRFGLVVNVVVAGAVVVAVTLALLRIRTRRAMRYGALAAAVAVAIGSAVTTATASPNQNAVERFHFVSFGLITFLFYRAAHTRPEADGSLIVVPMIAALTAGTADEWFQWFIPGRYGEIRDIFLNGSAIAAGVLFSLGVAPPQRLSTHLGADSVRRVARAGAVFATALAAFIHAVHLGHEIDDDGRRFRSRYSEAALIGLAAVREAEWRTVPPPLEIRPMSREDQYLAEGVWHIMARNAAWNEDVRAAWSENLILERYFGPVLDTPSYAAPAVSRWPAGQRSDAEARVLGVGVRQPFVSAAERHPIWIWPPVWLWTTTGIVVALLGGLAVAARRTEHS
jgi:VanZ family protein